MLATFKLARIVSVNLNSKVGLMPDEASLPPANHRIVACYASNNVVLKGVLGVEFTSRDHWIDDVFAFFASYVLYGYLISISLYVSFEFVKVFQAMVLLNRDRKMYHDETDAPTSARTLDR